MGGVVQEGVPDGVWKTTFPFLADFRSVVEGEVSLTYVDAIGRLLRPTIDALVDQEPSLTVARALSACVCAYARVELVQDFRHYFREGVDKAELLRVIEMDWVKLVEEEALLEVPVSDMLSELLRPMLADVWLLDSVSTMSTLREIVGRYRMVMMDMRYVALPHVVLVDVERGRRYEDLCEQDYSKPVLTVTAYSALTASLKQHLPVPEVGDPFLWCTDLAMGTSVFGDRTSEWFWLMLTSTANVGGYCYQLLVHPAKRYALCRSLAVRPRVDVLAPALIDTTWSGLTPGVRAVAGCYHVDTPGDYSPGLFPDGQFVVGQDLTVPVDYFARGLVDDFIKRVRGDPPGTSMSPIDGAFEQLSLDTVGQTSGDMVRAATQLFSAVGQPLSPRARQGGGPAPASLAAVTSSAMARDTDREAMLRIRLVEGACIPEEYFVRSRRRLFERRPRPRLDPGDGVCVHVFRGFPAEGNVSLARWTEDPQWSVSGWKSYVGVFESETSVVSFDAGPDALDVRVDCTGDGIIDFGGCNIHTVDTVWWFTSSVKFRVQTSGRLVLRVSVPEAGSVSVLGASMRRFMYVPGYCVAVRDFGIATTSTVLTVPLAKKAIARGVGYEVRGAKQHLHAGKTRMRFTGLAALTPVKLVVSVEPMSAFIRLEVSGVHLAPKTRDYVSVLCDLGVSTVAVALSENAKVKIAMLQIVDESAFDVSLRANALSSVPVVPAQTPAASSSTRPVRDQSPYHRRVFSLDSNGS